MKLSDAYLTTARELFTKDTDRDIRDLAYCEVLAVIGNRNTVRNLLWENVRLEECVIVFESHDYELDSPDSTAFGTLRVREIARIALPPEAVAPLTRLLNRVNDRCAELGIERRSEVFLGTAEYDGRFDGYMENRGGRARVQQSFWHMGNNEAGRIISRITSHLAYLSSEHREGVIEESPLAQALRLKIERKKAELAKLERELDYVVLNKGLPSKRKLNGGKNIPIKKLALNSRVHNALARSGITTIDAVRRMFEQGTDGFLSLRNFGSVALDELTAKMIEGGYM